MASRVDERARLLGPPRHRRLACTSNRPPNSRLTYSRMSALSSAQRMQGFSVLCVASSTVSETRAGSPPADIWLLACEK